MNTNAQQGIQRSCPAKAGHAVYAGRCGQLNKNIQQNH
jgi:hypothetical protein